MIGIDFSGVTYKLTIRWKIHRIYFMKKYWTPFVSKKRQIWTFYRHLPLPGDIEDEFKVGDITAMPGNIKARVYYIEGTVIYVTAPFTPLEIMCSNLLYFLGIRKIDTSRRIRKRKKDGH